MNVQIDLDQIDLTSKQRDESSKLILSNITLQHDNINTFLVPYNIRVISGQVNQVTVKVPPLTELIASRDDSTIPYVMHIELDSVVLYCEYQPNSSESKPFSKNMEFSSGFVSQDSQSDDLFGLDILSSMLNDFIERIQICITGIECNLAFPDSNLDDSLFISIPKLVSCNYFQDYYIYNCKIFHQPSNILVFTLDSSDTEHDIYIRLSQILTFSFPSKATLYIIEHHIKLWKYLITTNRTSTFQNIEQESSPELSQDEMFYSIVLNQSESQTSLSINISRFIIILPFDILLEGSELCWDGELRLNKLVVNDHSPILIMDSLVKKNKTITIQSIDMIDRIIPLSESILKLLNTSSNGYEKSSLNIQVHIQKTKIRSDSFHKIQLCIDFINIYDVSNPLLVWSTLKCTGKFELSWIKAVLYHSTESDISIPLITIPSSSIVLIEPKTNNQDNVDSLLFYPIVQIDELNRECYPLVTNDTNRFAEHEEHLFKCGYWHLVVNISDGIYIHDFVALVNMIMLIQMSKSLKDNNASNYLIALHININGNSRIEMDMKDALKEHSPLLLSIENVRVATSYSTNVIKSLAIQFDKIYVNEKDQELFVINSIFGAFCSDYPKISYDNVKSYWSPITKSVASILVQDTTIHYSSVASYIKKLKKSKEEVINYLIDGFLYGMDDSTAMMLMLHSFGDFMDLLRSWSSLPSCRIQWDNMIVDDINDTYSNFILSCSSFSLSLPFYHGDLDDSPFQILLTTRDIFLKTINHITFIKLDLLSILFSSFKNIHEEKFGSHRYQSSILFNTLEFFACKDTIERIIKRALKDQISIEKEESENENSTHLMDDIDMYAFDIQSSNTENKYIIIDDEQHVIYTCDNNEIQLDSIESTIKDIESNDDSPLNIQQDYLSSVQTSPPLMESFTNELGCPKWSIYTNSDHHGVIKMYIYEGSDENCNRIQQSHIDIVLYKISFIYALRPMKNDSVFPYRIVRLQLGHIDIEDYLKWSKWFKFMTTRWKDDQINTKTISLSIELTGFPAADNKKTLEYRLICSCSPLRFFIDQDTLNFLLDCFSSITNGSSGKVIDNSIFFQKVTIDQIPITIDFKVKEKQAFPSHITEGILGFVGGLEGAQLLLQRVNLSGVSGWNGLRKGVIDIWIPYVHNRDQVTRLMTSGIVPVRTLINIGTGVADLIMLPLESWTRQGKFWRGLRQGTTSFLKHTGLESVQLGNRLAKGTKKWLEATDQWIMNHYVRQREGSNSEERTGIVKALPIVLVMMHPIVQSSQKISQAFENLNIIMDSDHEKQNRLKYHKP